MNHIFILQFSLGDYLTHQIKAHGKLFTVFFLPFFRFFDCITHLFKN